MTTFPAGANNFQLPKPHKGVVFATEDGRVWVTLEGRTELVWTPPVKRAIDSDEE